MFLFSLMSRQLEYALGWMVLHSLWQGMLIALLTGVVLIVLRKQRASERYVLANLGLLAVVVLAGITFYVYFNNLNSWPYEGTTSWVKTDFPALPAPLDPEALADLEELRVDLAEEAWLEETPLAPLVALDQVNAYSIQAYFNPYTPFIVVLWLVGLAVFLLRLLGNVSYIYYLKSRMNFPADEYWQDLLDDLMVRTGLHKTLSLVESALVRTPQVVGYLKPVILFPLGMINRLPPAEVEAILAHELAHVLRHDLLLNVFQQVVETLFYYHPGVWWISAQIRTERESACDDIAVQITGDKLAYAQALVTVQEMGYLPFSSALAFAGQPKSQFMLRMQRILFKKSPTTNTMEKMLTVILVVGLLLGLGWIKNYGYNAQSLLSSQALTTTSQEDASLAAQSFGRSGYWVATIKGERVFLELKAKSEQLNWNFSSYFDKKEFSAFPTTESDFVLQRAAGSLNFKGKFEGNEGYGKFEFVANTDFLAYLKQQNIRGIEADDLFHLFIANVNKDYIAFLQSNGYKDLSSDNLIEMAIHGLDRETLEGYFAAFKKAGYGQVGINKLVELKIHGAGPAYLESFAKLGYNSIELEDLLEAKIHGLSADYIKAFQEQGYSKLPMEKLVEFKIHGLTADFARQMNQINGGKPLTPEELVSAKIHGLDPTRMEKMKGNSGAPVSIDDLQNYSIHGIDDNYLLELKEAGFGSLSPQEIIEAKIHGITGSYLKQLKEASGTSLSLERALEAKIHGLNPEQLKQYRSAYPNLSLSQAIEFKIHGVSGTFIQGFAELGFKDLSANKIMEMKIHGVSPDYIRKMQEKGFKNLSLDDYLKMKIHGIANK